MTSIKTFCLLLLVAGTTFGAQAAAIAVQPVDLSFLEIESTNKDLEQIKDPSGTYFKLTVDDILGNSIVMNTMNDYIAQEAWSDSPPAWIRWEPVVVKDDAPFPNAEKTIDITSIHTKEPYRFMGLATIISLAAFYYLHKNLQVSDVIVEAGDSYRLFANIGMDAVHYPGYRYNLKTNQLGPILEKNAQDLYNRALVKLRHRVSAGG